MIEASKMLLNSMKENKKTIKKITIFYFLIFLIISFIGNLSFNPLELKTYNFIRDITQMIFLYFCLNFIFLSLATFAITMIRKL